MKIFGWVAAIVSFFTQTPVLGVLIALVSAYVFQDTWRPYASKAAVWANGCYSKHRTKTTVSVPLQSELITLTAVPAISIVEQAKNRRAVARLSVTNVSNQGIRQCSARLVGFSEFAILPSEDIPLLWHGHGALVDIPASSDPKLLDIVNSTLGGLGDVFCHVATSHHLGFLGVNGNWCKIVVNISANDPWFSKTVELAARTTQNFLIDLCLWDDKPNSIEKITSEQSADLNSRLLAFGGNIDDVRRRFLAVMSTRGMKLENLTDIPAGCLNDAIYKIEKLKYERQRAIK